MAFVPHTEADQQAMLAQIGVNSIEDLFKEIPKSLRAKSLAIPQQLSELEVTQLLQHYAQQNKVAINFIGAGAYEHHIPAAVWDIVSRGEFMTAYTPYQAEASQGTLQLIYEYQTMMASLTGMDVANASLYDGASALAEAILMTVRLCHTQKPFGILVPQTLHPFYRQTIKTIVGPQYIEIIEVPYCHTTGRTLVNELEKFSGKNITALVIPQPNFFGVVENVDQLSDWAKQKNIFTIAVVNPTSLALLKEPGQWGTQGADMVCGEGQPLGIPLASGGPYCGFLACKKEYVRQMPGRFVGRTLDRNGNVGFALTLQAREQHIRRAKATSNICTNQGLLVTAATIYLSLLGPEGLRRIALACHHNTQALVAKLTEIPGVKTIFNSPYFHEVALRLPKPAKQILDALAEQGIYGGFDLSDHYPELENTILVCATETKTPEHLVLYQKQLAELL